MEWSEEKIQTMLFLLHENEEKISRVYRKFSQYYPNRTFWQHLEKEEVVHAQWVTALSQNKQEIFPDEKAFSLQAIQALISQYDELLSKDLGDLPLLEALGTALSFEKSMVESHFFDFFTTDSAAVKNIMADLEKGTEEHILFIEEEIRKQRIALRDL